VTPRRHQGCRLTAPVLAVLVGLAVSTPPPTASSAAPAGAQSDRTYWPGYSPRNAERPTLIQLGFAPNPDPRYAPTFVMIGTGYVSAGFLAIAWSSWGGETATGSGVARLAGQNSAGPIESQSDPVDVQVTLSGRTACGGASIYTDLSVALAPGQALPSDWEFARAQAGDHHQCWPIDGCPEAESTCTVDEDSFSDRAYLGTLAGRTVIEPDPFGPRDFLYRMRFRGWGSPTTVGHGLLVSAKSLGGCASESAACEQARVYPVRYTLANPRWCTAERLSGPHGDIGVETGLNYTTGTVEAFGAGKPLAGDPLAVPAPSYEQLLGQIGRPGKRYVTRSSLVHIPSPTGAARKSPCLAA
jgi:hypothetical protein